MSLSSSYLKLPPSPAQPNTPSKDLKDWNALIKRHAKLKNDNAILSTYARMLSLRISPDKATLPLVVKACLRPNDVELGKRIHSSILGTGLMQDVRVATSLVDFYCKCGLVEDARYVFDRMTERDVVLWNAMINGYVGVGDHEEAISVFLEMGRQSVKPSSRTVVALLLACGKAMELRVGQEIHCYSLRSGLFHEYPHVGTALIGFYAKFNVKVSHNVFDMMEVKNMASWNANITGYFEAGNYLMVLKLFVRILENWGELDEVTMLIVIQACTKHGSLGLAMQIHQMIIKSDLICDVYSANALLHMYSKLQKPEFAYEIFKSVPACDVVLWNSMISTYIDFSCPEEAQSLFLRMLTEDSEIKPNSYTIISILASCDDAPSLDIGRSIHGYCIHAYITRRESSIGSDASLANALITMYAKCGSLHDAEKVFNLIWRRDIISWNAMITCYGMHGQGEGAISTFLQMLEDGVKPNSATFVSILSACSHCGLIEEGLLLYNSMSRKFKVNPELIHYGCVVDLLGRGGYLDEALNFINSMPIEADATVWRALLSACQVHSNTKLVKLVFEKIVELEPINEGNYVLLSNIYAAAGLWSDVRLIRAWLKEKGLRKPPGISWIVIRNQAHVFTARGQSHPQTDLIYAILSSLSCSIKDAGYVSDIQWILLGEES
ncbi:uncharacterized protein J3R85_020495 [Psidium guajava]|nr:uncharacterized protein J3R85_020495 [Psidium guajava]